MRINRVEFNLNTLVDFTKIIDVRSESEFFEDRIPSAYNLPVLNNEERIIIGTKYKENSFEARKNGALIISKNISKIIKKNIFKREDKILIYCWRGGLRSLSLYLVLKQIGFNVVLLEGGYKSYRKYIVKFFQEDIHHYKFNQVKGVTGVGKTLFLKTLKKKFPILDLEGLAKHKGSILGDLPGVKQPSQKFFETIIHDELKKIDISQSIWVESESIKIGKLSIPDKLWKKMALGTNIKLEAPLKERVNFILKDYKYFIEKPNLMTNSMIVLKKIIKKEDYLIIEKNLSKGDFSRFVENLITNHYDKAYKKTRSEVNKENDIIINLNKINGIEFLKIIKNNKIFH